METTTNKQKFGVLLPIVLVSYFLILLNNSIVFTSSIQISQELHMNSTMISWVSNAYALTFGGFLALGARLGDIFKRKTIFLIGLLIFGVSSLFVALAANQGFLIAMRAIQGVGGTLLAPASLALLMDNYRDKMLTKAIAYYGATAGVGASLGLIIGGFITSYSSWRNGFYLDIVVSFALLLFSMRFVPTAKQQEAQRNIDYWGSLTSVIGFSTLVYSINATYLKKTALVIAIISLVSFVLIENKVKEPLIPLEIFKNNQRSSALFARFFAMGASLSYFFLMPQALQQIFGITPLMAAIYFLPLTVLQFIASLFVARLSFKTSNATVMIAGAVINTIGLLFGAYLGIGRGYLIGVFIPMIFIGIGQGLVFSPLTIAGVADVKDQIAGAASGAVNTVHQIGGAVGLAIVSSATSSITSPANMIDQAQIYMSILAIIMLLACLNVLRRPHK